MLTFTTKKTGDNTRDVFARETETSNFVKIAENANSYDAVNAMRMKREELNTSDSIFMPNMIP
jgi:hypothetical protein